MTVNNPALYTDESSSPHGFSQELPAELAQALKSLLPTANICCHRLDIAHPLQLWLIDPNGMDVPLTEQETDAIFETPPYWSFCWGSGKALASRILENPELVAGKTVLDFGSGSGVVAIAAAQAGAGRVIACDIDATALAAVRYNAVLNGVTLEYLDDFFASTEKVDLLLAADVLYDPENIPLLQAFQGRAREVLVADSRVKNFSHPGFEKTGEIYSVTEPDLGEIEDVKTVRFYRARSE